MTLEVVVTLEFSAAAASSLTQKSEGVEQNPQCVRMGCSQREVFHSGQTPVGKRQTLRGRGIGRGMRDILCLITDKNRCLRKQKTCDPESG